MDQKTDSYLHFSDLKLLMDNYQNVVKLNTILLEQQKQIIELQKDIIRNQAGIIKDQGSLYDKIEKVLTRLDSGTDQLKQANDNYKCLEGALHSRFDAAVIKVEDTKESIDNCKLDMIKQHSGISLRLYIALGGSIAIIITLITLLVSTYDKLSTIENIQNMIQKIMIGLNLVS